MSDSTKTNWIGRVTVGVAALLLLFGLVFHRNHSKFHQRVEQLFESGVLVPLNELTYTVPNPKDDALSYLRTVLPIAREYSNQIPGYQRGQPQLNEESLAAFREFIAQHPDFFATVSKAAASPEISFSVFSDQVAIGSALDLRPVITMMVWQGYMQITAGDQPQAIQSGLEILQLCERLSQPSLLPASIANNYRLTACHLIYEAIQIQHPSAEIIDQIKSVLQKMDVRSSFQAAVKGEASLLLLTAMDNQSIAPRQPDSLDWVRSVLRPFFLAYTGNQIIDDLESTLAKSEVSLIQPPVDDKRGSWSLGNPPSRVFENFRANFGYADIAKQCLLVLLALIEAEADASADLESYSLDYLESIGVDREDAIDPFMAGQPLTVRKQGDRWLIYTVGPNRQDDGGLPNTDDFGFGSWR